MKAARDPLAGGAEAPADRIRRAIGGEPFPALLFPSLAGSLTPASLLAQLVTPGAVVDAARGYGLAAPEP